MMFFATQKVKSPVYQQDEVEADTLLCGEEPEPGRPVSTSSQHRQEWRVYTMILAMGPKCGSFVVTGILLAFLVLSLNLILSFPHGADTALRCLSRHATFDPGTRENFAVTQGCGPTPAAAAHRECVFDLMLYGWTPRECFNEAAHNAAMARGPWEWYYDQNATKLLPGGQDVELLSGEMEMLAEWNFRVVHCLYAWDLPHRAAMSGDLVREDIGSYEHTQHCSAVLRRRIPPEAVIRNKALVTTLHSCVSLSLKRGEADSRS